MLRVSTALSWRERQGRVWSKAGTSSFRIHTMPAVVVGAIRDADPR